MEETIVISDEFITLGQALKEAAVIDSGGQAKWFLAEIPVWVNDEQENRRGRKLYPGDRVEVEEMGTILIASDEE
ncbi:S4 domain-containing protein YaaA [Salipaludibacillus sp. CUR1]|uniref:S4 domain protein YaaA n=1 Tax=Salipaludibacillus aurantiacus TaxID=1601833 RepID=A0A1H9VNH2_9BACI|nr:S4 domain-containing protein YaaA [Salipaludibacillus aurantiacus]MCE7790998.1 S4 domain-containing protein YaaA [Salipaludibacillus sp. CUR1]SES22887.1 S4 domain protein YaaA [Salipaludibacillus aurantiacus]